VLFKALSFCLLKFQLASLAVHSFKVDYAI
jgi:hypothetical protein